MKRIVTVLFVLLSGLALNAYAVKVASVTKHRPSAKASGRVIKEGSDIHNKDIVTTNTTGRAKLEFTDGSSITVFPNSNFRINDYAYGSAKKKFDATLLKGGFRAVTGGIRDSAYSVKVGNIATIGVRGTSFIVHMEKDGTFKIAVTSGLVNVRPRSGAMSSISAGQVALVSQSGATFVPGVTPESLTPESLMIEAEATEEQVANEEEAVEEDQDAANDSPAGLSQDGTPAHPIAIGNNNTAMVGSETEMDAEAQGQVIVP